MTNNYFNHEQLHERLNVPEGIQHRISILSESSKILDLLLPDLPQNVQPAAEQIISEQTPDMTHLEQIYKLIEEAHEERNAQKAA